MVQPYLEFLPQSASTPVIAALVVVAIAGAALWVAGARFSRFLTTLITVTLGAAVGMQMPRWFGWQISGAGPAVGMAVVLGVSGFVLHGMWMGLLLGIGLAAWSGFIVGICTSGGQPIAWPAADNGLSCIAWCAEVWRNLPPGTSKYLPYTTSLALISGLACAILWTRLTTAVAWSLAGATMVLTCTLAALKVGSPQILDGQIPQMWVQIAGVLVMVAIGSAIQLKLAPKPKPAKKSPGGKPAEKSSIDRPI